MKYTIFLLFLGYLPSLYAQDCYKDTIPFGKALGYQTKEPFNGNPLYVGSATVLAEDTMKNSALICSFKNLSHLTLYNSISQDDFLGLKDLNCLKFVWIGGCVNSNTTDKCRFYTIPKGMCLAPNLKELKVTTSDIRSIPACVFEHPKLELFSLHNFYSKDTLHLSGNIINPGNIRKLTIVGNSLYSIPEGFCNQPNLEWFDLRKNKLKTLPKDIHLLKKVKMLDISENPIESLPETFGEMDGLITLNLSNTKLTKFPEVLFKLKKIRRIHLTKTECTKDGDEREAIYNKFVELGNDKVVIFW